MLGTEYPPMVKSVWYQRREKMCSGVVQVGFFCVYFRMKNLPYFCMNAPFYRLLSHRSSADLIDLILNSDDVLGWDIRMSVHPHVRGLPRNIYDFVCLSPRGILPGGSPRSLAFNALNHPSDLHWMQGFGVSVVRSGTSSLNRSALMVFRSVHLLYWQIRSASDF